MSGAERDAVLVRRAQSGDRTAFEELVSLYERPIYTLAYRYLGNHHDAGDAAQETFLRVYRKLRAFHARSTFSTWLYRVAANTCLDEVRRKRRWARDREGNPAGAPDADPWDVPGAAGDPEDALEQAENRRRVQEALGRLAHEQRAILLLREVQGLSYEEIAPVFGCSVGTVKSRLSRARWALKDVLVERDAGSGGGVSRAV